MENLRRSACSDCTTPSDKRARPTRFFRWPGAERNSSIGRRQGDLDSQGPLSIYLLYRKSQSEPVAVTLDFRCRTGMKVVREHPIDGLAYGHASVLALNAIGIGLLASVV